jgi:hypothetical protein
MKLLFIDTEFTDFINTDLISLGAITEDGSKEFYFELTDFNQKICSEFVRNAILPELDLQKFGMRRHEASARFYQWLEELGDEYVICPDYMADWDCAIDLLDNETPSNIATSPLMYFSHINKLIYDEAEKLNHPDLKWFFEQAKSERTKAFLNYFEKNPFPKQHHALADAKANREGYFAVVDWLKSHSY